MDADMRRRWRARLAELWTAPPAESGRLLAALTTQDAAWKVAAPFDELTGPAQVSATLLAPLHAAFAPLLWRDDIFLAGTSVTGSGDWVSAVGHLVGNFRAPLCGIAPNHHVVFLRAGVFLSIDGDRVAGARILIDMPDLLRQAGRLSLPSLGTEMLFPAPATHDGVRLAPSAGADSATSLDIVQRMLTGLGPYDPATFASAAQTGAGGTWHPDMLWYGPAAIGSNLTYDGFQKDHRIPFLTGFPDRRGGNHFARFGDGPYVCSGGWPSITATHAGDYLGVAATGRPVTMRVMDFWRTQDGLILENWVFIDLVDLFRQLGVDLIAGAAPP